MGCVEQTCYDEKWWGTGNSVIAAMFAAVFGWFGEWEF